jgi:CRISPR-associated protein (TIGR02584 family)
LYETTPEQYERRILLAVTGLSPQILTETIYALAIQQKPAFVPTEVHLVTTGKGAEHARLNLLGRIGWFQRLCEDWQLPQMSFGPGNIHVIPGADGNALEDIRNVADNGRAADFITARVAELTSDPQAALHVSLAGGRKTMGYYLGYALSLFGRTQDRLSHVLVSPPYEYHRDFYYPTPQEQAIHVQEGGKDIAYDCRAANVELAGIPFVRLRQGLPEQLLNGDVRFSEAVAAAQPEARAMELRIDVPARRVTVGEEAMKLPPTEFAILLWLAKRQLEGAGPIICNNTSKSPSHENAQAYLTVCREAFGPHAAETVKAENAFKKNGMESDWLSPHKSRINRAMLEALGRNRAAHYQIQTFGPRKEGRFGLRLAPKAIHINLTTPLRGYHYGKNHNTDHAGIRTGCSESPASTGSRDQTR